MTLSQEALFFIKKRPSLVIIIAIKIQQIFYFIHIFFAIAIARLIFKKEASNSSLLYHHGIGILLRTKELSKKV